MLLGVDLQRVDRVRRLLEATRRARERTFSPAEIVYCESKGVKRWQHYATRYAAKEATMKALGTGYRGTLHFHEIEVLPGPLGRPQQRFADSARALLRRAGVTGSLVSLSGDAHYASATVILLAEPPVPEPAP